MAQPTIKEVVARLKEIDDEIEEYEVNGNGYSENDCDEAIKELEIERDAIRWARGIKD